MPARVLVVSKSAEVEALGAAFAEREDFTVVPCSRGAQIVAAIEAGPPELAILRLRLADVDGLDLSRRIRNTAPAARIFMILDVADLKLRDACFKAGCEDVLFTPLDAADAVRRIAGVDERRFRREPRVPLGERATMVLPDGPKELIADSLSELGIRLRWSDAKPSRVTAPLTLELEPGTAWTVWVRLEDVATRKGIPEAVLARFMGLTSDDRLAIGRALQRLRGARGGMLEPPSAPIVLDRVAPPAEEAYEPLAPPPVTISRRRLTAGFAAVCALGAIGSVVFAWAAISAIRHPERQYEKNPEKIVDGLRVKAVHRFGTRVVVRADASWNDLGAEGRERSVVKLAGEMPLAKHETLEVWTVAGHVATATVDSGGAVRFSAK